MGSLFSGRHAGSTYAPPNAARMGSIIEGPASGLTPWQALTGGGQKYNTPTPQYSGVQPTLGLANQLYAQQFAPPPAPANAAPGAAPAAAPSPLPAGIFGAPAAGRAPGQAQPNGWGMPTTQPTSATAGRSIYG